MAKIIEYKIDAINWVTIHSITPINKVKRTYDGLNLVLENEITYVILWFDSRNKLRSDEIPEYYFKDYIRITYNND